MPKTSEVILFAFLFCRTKHAESQTHGYAYGLQVVTPTVRRHRRRMAGWQRSTLGSRVGRDNRSGVGQPRRFVRYRTCVSPSPCVVQSRRRISDLIASPTALPNRSSTDLSSREASNLAFSSLMRALTSSRAASGVVQRDHPR